MKLTLGAGLLVALILVTGCNRPPQMAELSDGSQIPIGRTLWPAPGDVPRRLEAAGLPDVKGQGEDYHLHVHLQVFKDGRQVLVPANVGVGQGVLAPVHTHEDHGVIHVESPTPADFTLGQFFRLWDVSLDGAKLIVNGQERDNPTAYVFKDSDLITVYWGDRPQ